MSQLHLKNHYVPESYLKRWTNNQAKVHVYRILVEHPNVPTWKAHSVSAIAYHKHLYTQLISGSESDWLEIWLDREFESPANHVLDKATSERKLTPSDWEKLIKFLAAQDVRTPDKLIDHLKKGQKTISETLNEVLEDLPKKPEKVEASETVSCSNSTDFQTFPLKVHTQIDESTDSLLLKAETYVGRSTWIYLIKHQLNNTSKILHTHKWSIVKPAKGYFWPTSDNPVIKLNYYSQGKYDLFGGWNVTKGNIFFPIGPEHAMFVQIGERPILKYKRLSISLTKELIKIIAENAHRKIFCHTENQNLPHIRKRIVDAKTYQAEAEELRNWHEENLRLERMFFSSPKNP